MKIAFTSSHNPLAQQALTELSRLYGQHAPHNADVIVALGGDGHVMKTLYDVMEIGTPVYPMRRTESVGFLCNDYHPETLPERLQVARPVILHPLSATTRTVGGDLITTLAINEVSILRETQQAARLTVAIDGIERLNKYSGDGLLVATPAGSTAYNHSCGGPIMPIDANTLVITAICGYRPRGWKNAILPQTSRVTITALETDKRPVRMEAGSAVVHAVQSVEIRQDTTTTITLLCDPDQHLGERIVREQFMI